MSGAPERVVRICLDVNVLVSDFLCGKRRSAAGAASKIVDLVRNGTCALGPIQLLLSWRMLTTLAIVLERLGETPDTAWATSELLAAVAEFGPLREPPTLVLGGAGLLPLMDLEDVGVAETAFVGEADLFVTADLDDFALGPRSGLQTTRVMETPGRKLQVLIMENPAGRAVVAAAPEIAVGWLLGQAPLPPKVAAILARTETESDTKVTTLKGPG